MRSNQRQLGGTFVVVTHDIPLARRVARVIGVDDRPEALEVRVRRAVETSRRARLYLKLIAILQREASEHGQSLVDDILDLLLSNSSVVSTVSTWPLSTKDDW